MKQVFRLLIKIENYEFELYFEDQNTSDKTIAFLDNMLTNKGKKKIIFLPEIHEVYPKNTPIEEIMKSLGMKESDLIN